MTKAIQKAAAVLTALTVLLTGVYAYAVGNRMNTDYLSRDKWYHLSKAVCVPFYEEGIKETVSGKLYYVTDDNLCLYTHIVLDGNSAVTDLSTARIVFDFTTASEHYTVCADTDGMNTEETPSHEQSLFSVESNFENAQNGEYLCAAEYLGKESGCYAEVRIYFRSPHLLTQDSILMTLPPSPTTQKASAEKHKQTTARQKEKSGLSPARTTTSVTQKTTRRAASSRSAGSRTKKATTVPETKYTPTGITVTEAQEEAPAQEVYRESTFLEQQKQTALSGGARMLLLCGIVIGVIALMLLAGYILSGRYRLVRRDEKKEEPPAGVTQDGDPPATPSA